MKGVIAAAVVLCAVALLVAVNAVYVHHVTDRLTVMLDELPALPDPATTPDAVAETAAYLKQHMTPLSLSVNYTLPDRIAESLAALEASAEQGDRFQYAATLAVLRDLCEDLSRSERLKIENIF